MAAPARGGRGPERRVGLTAERVVDAALELSRDRGLHAWSQRDLARRLDVAPSVLYHHVGGRDRIVRAVVERLVAEFPSPSPDLEWREWFRAAIYPGREVLLRCPGAAAWLLRHGPSFPGATPTFDAGVGSLRRAGVPHPAMAYAAIFNTAILTISLADDRLEPGEDGPGDHVTMLAEFAPLEAGSSGVAAVVEELMRPLAAGGSAADEVSDAYFRYVVEALLEGIARTVATPPD